MQNNINESTETVNDKIKDLTWSLVKKKDLLFYVIVAMSLLAVVVYKSKEFIFPPAKTNMILIQKTYAQWENSSDQKIFDKLSGLIHKNPMILTTYQTQIAQKLLWNKEHMSLKENLFAKETSKKLNTEIPFYPAYAATSILIADKKYQDALIGAKALKTAMQNATKIPVLMA